MIRTILINENFCEMQCYQEPNCVGYNFKKNGENKCDLNNATYEHDNEQAGDLAEDENYVYREAGLGVKFKIESNNFIWKCKTLNNCLELFWVRPRNLVHDILKIPNFRFVTGVVLGIGI